MATTERIQMGAVFTRLTVIGDAFKSSNGKRQVTCRCECGKVKPVDESELRRGRTRSCGCWARDKARNNGARNRTHNMSSTPIYKIWSSMMQRCYDEARKDFPKYGGRGIEVCVRWWSFENFFADMGHRPPGKSLNRVENDAGYSPENCQWDSLKTQARNTTQTRYLEHDGRRMCVTAWAEELGMSSISLEARLRRGWSVERSLTTPIDQRFSRV